MNDNIKKKKSMQEKIEDEIQEKLENNEELDDSEVGYLRFNNIEEYPNDSKK